MIQLLKNQLVLTDDFITSPDVERIVVFLAEAIESDINADQQHCDIIAKLIHLFSPTAHQLIHGIAAPPIDGVDLLDIIRGEELKFSQNGENPV